MMAEMNSRIPMKTPEIIAIIKDIGSFAALEEFSTDDKLMILYALKEDHAVAGTNVNLMVSEFINNVIISLEETEKNKRNEQNNKN